MLLSSDAVFQVQSWLSEKSGLPKSEVNLRFGIPEDLEYLE